MFAGEQLKKGAVAVALWAIDPSAVKPLKLFSQFPRAAFYTPCWPNLLASHGALQAGQNKLTLDEEIPKLDQPV